MGIRKVGVVGCGLMGSGIVQTAAQCGFEVKVREVSQELLAKGLSKIEGVLSGAVKKEKMTAQEKDAVMARISGTTRVEDLADCDLVIEAVNENVELKQDLWRRLDGLCPPTTIFASNTSSIPIRVQAEVTSRSDRFIGLHFFNPVPVMKLVEVIRAQTTSDATYNEAMEFSKTLGKTPVTCIDTAGFIVNRLLVPYLFDAVRALEAGIATPEDIDTGMKLGCGHPMGPLTLLDFVGLDTALAISHILYDAFGLPHYKAPKLLEKLVAEGKLGRKSGEGVYKY
ncbi:MAG: 3-hydroxybutyryl-CoA dehydrogenase [Deltaproteobacteria bacterium]|nr:3-hydroxybutyryl-CoA dehydrogenase [Deltaproteobacteria bacterium]